MPKLTKSNEWLRIATAIINLESLGRKPDAKMVASHTHLNADDISVTMKDLVFRDYLDSARQKQYGLWGRFLAMEGEEFASTVKELTHQSLFVLRDLLNSDDEKVRAIGVRLVHDISPDLVRPVVRHEITNRFTNDELDQAREIVKKVKGSNERPKLPKLPSGESPVN